MLILKTSYQSISKTKTFTPPTSDYAYIKAQLFRNVESACIKLRRYYLRAKRLIIYVRQHDYRSDCMQTDLNRATVSPLELFPVVERVLCSLYRNERRYRLTGVVLTNLEEDVEMQFDNIYAGE